METAMTFSCVLGVDLDGVCADFYARMREIAAEWFECDIDTLTEDVTYGLKEWGVEDTEQYASLHRFAVTQRQLFETMPRPVYNFFRYSLHIFIP